MGTKIDFTKPSTLPLSDTGKFTRESLLVFSQLNPDIRAELDERGNIILMSPTSTDSGQKSGKFFGKLFVWNENNGELGYLFDSSTGFTLPDTSVKSPDAAWIEKKRYEKLDSAEKKKYAKIVPDLIAEVRSVSDNFNDTYEKCRKWLANGVKEVWCIDPGEAIVVLRKEVELRFKKNETAQSQILSGFELKVSDF